MALPLIPLILGGGAVLTGIFGIGKGIKAASDSSKADDVNDRARRLQKDIKRRLQRARDRSKKALESLGEKKLHVCKDTVGTFVKLFGKVKNVRLAASKGMDELEKFRIDKQNLIEMKDISIKAGSFAKGVLSGSLTGGAVAFGAYSAAGALATASTGTAIAGLSGAAATNATLAFFGGGSLAAGGLGIAGGMTVLGGVVAGPALLILGSIMGAKASEKLDNAYSNLAKVREAEAEVQVLAMACNGIADRADLYLRVLVKLESLAFPLLDSLESIIRKEGTDYSRYKAVSKQTVAALLSTMKAIKAILDTPILDKKGALTKQSAAVIKAVQNELNPSQVSASSSKKSRKKK